MARQVLMGGLRGRPLVLGGVTLTCPARAESGLAVTAPGALLMPVLVYPVLEEVVFRGLLQDFLARRIKSCIVGPLTAANLITSIAFTACHLFYHAPLWSALVFLPSLVFGYFKDKYQNLAIPIVLHVFYNAGYYWLFAVP